MPKHIPERSCVACRKKRPKRHLVRLVYTPDTGVEVDTSWRKPGRGAYLCPAQECWTLAARRKSLDHEFEMTVTAQGWEALNAYAAGLPLHNHDDESSLSSQPARSAAPAAGKREQIRR